MLCKVIYADSLLGIKLLILGLHSMMKEGMIVKQYWEGRFGIVNFNVSHLFIQRYNTKVTVG